MLYLFYGSTCMVLNIGKLAIHFPKSEVDSCHFMVTLFSFLSCNIQESLKYMGYNINPNNDGIEDYK
jgi:hypothetical protein